MSEFDVFSVGITLRGLQVSQTTFLQERRQGEEVTQGPVRYEQTLLRAIEITPVVRSSPRNSKPVLNACICSSHSVTSSTMMDVGTHCHHLTTSLCLRPVQLTSEQNPDCKQQQHEISCVSGCQQICWLAR